MSLKFGGGSRALRPPSSIIARWQCHANVQTFSKYAAVTLFTSSMLRRRDTDMKSTATTVMATVRSKAPSTTPSPRTGPRRLRPALTQPLRN